MEQIVGTTLDPEGESQLPSDLESRLGPEGSLLWQVAIGVKSGPPYAVWSAMQDYAASRGEGLLYFSEQRQY